MTFMPALLSSAARIAPVPPTPTITTSVFSVAIAQDLSSLLSERGNSFPRSAVQLNDHLPRPAATGAKISRFKSGICDVLHSAASVPQKQPLGRFRTRSGHRAGITNPSLVTHLVGLPPSIDALRKAASISPIVVALRIIWTSVLGRIPPELIFW
jgi:hypothetical protein